MNIKQASMMAGISLLVATAIARIPQIRKIVTGA